MTVWEIMRKVSQGILVVSNASLHVEEDLLEKSSGLSHPLTHDASGKFRKEMERVLFNPFQLLLISFQGQLLLPWDRGCQSQPNTP